ncbi:hypothetical protein [Bradyrhizobium sp. USDA 329]|uniref:hypothetical protein n=1 Tax=Bradyrhizobium sp. USDA 329 TaxID=3156310 RepID=UPI003510FBB8
MTPAIAARSVIRIAATFGSRQASSSRRNVSGAAGLPSNAARVHCLIGIAAANADVSWWGLVERDHDAVAVDGRIGVPAQRGRGEDEVFGGTAETDEEMMIVRIDGRTAALEVRRNRDDVAADRENPRLGVVAVGREGGKAHEFAIPRHGLQRSP